MHNHQSGILILIKIICFQVVSVPEPKIPPPPAPRVFQHPAPVAALNNKPSLLRHQNSGSAPTPQPPQPSCQTASSLDGGYDNHGGVGGAALKYQDSYDDWDDDDDDWDDDDSSTTTEQQKVGWEQAMGCFIIKFSY